MAPNSRLRPRLLRLFLPLPQPAAPPALAVSGERRRRARGAAGDSPGAAFTSQQNRVSGPSAGDLCALGARNSPEQDGRQQ